MMAEIAQNLKNVQGRIEEAAKSAGRDPLEVRLISVTKTVDAGRIREAIAAGASCFGENYVQEAREKIEDIGRDCAQWHFIGHLQRNKVKYIFGLFDMIHSVESIRLAEEIDRRANRVGEALKVLIEVNVSGEESKFGIDEKEAIDLIRAASKLEGIRIEGLMTMPPYFDDPEKSRPYFKQLRRLRDRISEEGFENVRMTELSMGMTADFEAAIQEGATMVRVGTAIFGPRL
jgi:pyridoxal phosphate enzyme (YggS family)